ncbi:MAG: N-acetylmuramoyl-L-alanine amidase [Clostridiales bacterium]|nr:N-acetylmuramoyl-L-alanine amidase [Clostridiales bacterium]
MIDISERKSTVNTSERKNRTIKYIVIHYTAGTTSKSGAARNVASYFMSGSAGGSADYIVDDENIVLYNPDIENRYCWAVGGSKYASTTTAEGGKYYGVCTNLNSINVEICSNKTNVSSLSAYDTDWYFTEATVSKALELTKYLMEKHDISAENVIMHHHVTGKICPNPWCVNEERLSQWESFKSKLSENKEDEEMVEAVKINLNGTEYTVNRILKDGKNYICLADLSGKGFDVGYDRDTKTPSLSNTINDISVKVDGQAETVKAVNIGGYYFSKIRDFVDILGGLEIDYKDETVIINNIEKD